MQKILQVTKHNEDHIKFQNVLDSLELEVESGGGNEPESNLIQTPGHN